jgi:ribosomal protein L37AE/L43A
MIGSKNNMAAEKSLQGVEGEGVSECPECRSKKVTRHDDELFCEVCGFVID